jgi:hypothetical protein
MAARPATLGAWILPRAQALHPPLMRDRFRGDLTGWLDALTPSLLAAWETEDRRRIEAGCYTSWASDGLPEARLAGQAVLLRGNAYLRQGRNGQPVPPRPQLVRFVHRLRFVDTPHGLHLDALEEVHWGEWQQADLRHGA